MCASERTISIEPARHFAFQIGVLVVIFAFARPVLAAIPECTSGTLQAAAPPGVTIGDITDLGFSGVGPTVKGVADVPANAAGDGAPEYCLVTGTVVTSAQTGRTANFAAVLPAKKSWNGKFMFQGCGGNCGMTFILKPSPVLLRWGYPIFATDDGHIGRGEGMFRMGDTSWAVKSSGRRDEEAVTDFFFRATHAVIMAGKELTRKYYGTSKLTHAYFDGCSDGGRDGMVELSRYPTDFDGIIAGDPYFDIGGEIANSLAGVQVQLRSPDGVLTPALLKRISQIVTAKCDAADGVTDGLIQNPAACNFDPEKDLPRCTPGSSSQNCFTNAQIESLSVALSAITEPSGTIVYPGYPVSNLDQTLANWLGISTPPEKWKGPLPWSHMQPGIPFGWDYGNQTSRYLIYADAPGFDALSTPGITFGRGPVVEAFHAVMPAKTVALLRARTRAGDGNNPASTDAFFGQHRKLIMYDGFSDGDITPYSTTRYYMDLARRAGGYANAQRNARLFLAPGMGHCSGGAGPNSFGQMNSGHLTDTAANNIVAALEAWVERGRAPNSIIATKYENDDPKKPVVRTMPLCPFPAMARFSGSGDLNDSRNWSCQPKDQRLLELGNSGRNAGAHPH